MKKKKSNFEIEIKKILTTYNPSLVEIENFPNLDEKKIIKTSSFKDIINVRKMINRPIYYLNNKSSYSFVIFDKNDAYIYVLTNERQNKFKFEDFDKEDDIELLES